MAPAMNLEQTSFNYQVYFTQKDLTFFLVFATFSWAELTNDFLQPNPKYWPREVIEIQLRALQ